jgi:hypothetical protein
MKLSSDKDHPDYNPTMLPALVYLNGAMLLECTHADEEAGEAVCVVRGADGLIVLEGDEIRTETRRGQIRIAKRFTPGEDFDAWMHRRTDAAHKAFMAREGLGGA